MNARTEFSGQRRTERAFRTTGRIVALCAWSLPFACSGSGSGGDPTGPPPVTGPAPVITAIQPAQAAPGERITIRGERFQIAPEPVSVTFWGRRATVILVTETTIEAVVPNVSAGAAPVVVTVGDRSSSPFAYQVLQSPVPIITAIEPAQAAPGDQITLRGEHFGVPGEPISVTISDRQALLVSATQNTVVVVVPYVATGAARVVVSVGERSSDPFAYQVLRAPAPVIENLFPDPVRADLRLTIAGRNFRTDSLEVLIDEIPVTWISVTGEAIAIRLPARIALGTHSLRVQIGGDTTPSRPFTVDDFSVTGTYSLQATVISSSCPEPNRQVGKVRNLSISLTDRRPELFLVGADPSLTSGTVTSDGNISAGTRTLPSLFPTLFGTVTPLFEIDLTINHGSFLSCSWREHATGKKVSG